MIGQEKLLTKLDKLIERNKLPRFTILVGPKGSGKKMIVNHIKEQVGDALLSTYGISVDDIRQLIIDCNKLSGVKNICLLPDADGMSVQAKNAMLKIAEEPPKNTYIIMTLEDINNTLDTIKSRAAVFSMDPYSVPEILEYCKSRKYKKTEIIQDICETPGEVDLLCSYDVGEFYDYVNKTVDNIAKVNGANVFKLADKLELKEKKDGSAAGYNIGLFLKMFIRICMSRYDQELDDRYMKGIQITSQYLKDLRIKGISRQGLIDLWILDIRKEWM